MHGDSPWSIIAELERDEVDLYLAERKAKGFNTLLVNLLERTFASNAPANIYGDQPFLTQGDYATPNEAYFANADWVLERAAEEGFLVLLVPSYVGFRGTPQGWWAEMEANGAEKLRAYGRYVGGRYARFDNIMWVQGGDDNPPDLALVDALAAGIAEADPTALQTVHTAPETAPLDAWPDRAWIDVNNVYTYEEVYAPSIEEYRRSELPFFLMESAYEDERPVSTRRLRTQAWHALLAGATGQLFGNNPVWHFSGPGLEAPPRTWQEALDSPGASSMAVVASVYGALPWWQLVPDEVSGTLLADEKGSGHDLTVAALACDGTWALVYAPDQRAVTLDMAQFSGSSVQLTWIDPTTGAEIPATPASGANAGELRVPTPGANAEGESDWLLRATS